MDNLSLMPICKTHKKPCQVLWAVWYKKVRKICCEEIINLNGTVEATIINWVIHL